MTNQEFDTEVTWLRPRLVRIARRRARVKANAEDAVQLGLASLVKGLAQLNVNSFEGLAVTAIIRKLAHVETNCKLDSPNNSGRWLSLDVPSPRQVVQAAEDTALVLDVRRAVEMLGKQGAPVVARFWLGYERPNTTRAYPALRRVLGDYQ